MLYTKRNSWKLRLYLVKECEVLIAKSLIEEWGSWAGIYLIYSILGGLFGTRQWNYSSWV